MLTSWSPGRRFMARTPRAVRPKGRNSSSLRRKWMVMPLREPIRMLSPGRAKRTQVRASPSTRSMAIKPLERMLAKADRRVRLIVPPLVSITSTPSSVNSLTASSEVICSSRGIGNICTIGVPLAARLQIGTR